MIGTNEFHLNTATMRLIVEHYLNTVVHKPDEAVQVASFFPTGDEGMYVAVVQPPEEKK